MSPEILRADELYEKGEITEGELLDPNIFKGRRGMRFPNRGEATEFVARFLQDYERRHGPESSNGFPIYEFSKGRPLYQDFVDVAAGINRPVLLAIPENRFSEVEAFLGI
jgi:hypothetical protein